MEIKEIIRPSLVSVAEAIGSFDKAKRALAIDSLNKKYGR